MHKTIAAAGHTPHTPEVATELLLPGEHDEVAVTPALLRKVVEAGAVGWGAEESLARSLAGDVASAIRRMHEERAAAWPETPDVPGAPDPEPLPLEVLPAALRDHARSVADATQVPVDLPLLLALGCVSAAVAGRVEVSVRAGWTEPVGLYVASIFPPAGRKSPTYAAMVEPLREWETESIRRATPRVLAASDVVEVTESKLAATKAAAAKNKATPVEVEAARLELEKARAKVPPDGRLLAGDITPEAMVQRMAAQGGRLAILEPEPGPLQLLAGRYSDTALLDELKKAWSAEPLTVDRVGRPPVRVDRPALSLVLMLQPGVLEALQNGKAFRVEGVLGRFLWCRPPHRLGERLTGADVPSLDGGAAEKYKLALRALLDMQPAPAAEDGTSGPYVLRLSPGAVELLHAWEAEVEGGLGDGGRYAGVLDWAGKMVGQSIRVAALLELAARAGDGRVLPGDTIGPEAMDGAVRLFRALGTHALAVLVEELGTDPRTALLRYVLRRARELPEGGTLRDLYELTKGRSAITSMDDLLPLVDDLHAREALSKALLGAVRDGGSRFQRSWGR